MKKVLLFILLILNLPLIAMEYGWHRRQSLASTEQRLLAYKESMRQRYYPDVVEAQTPDGREIAYAYFHSQLMKRPLPNGIPFEQAYIYWGEMILNPNDPFIPALKDYARQVLTLAFELRKSTLKKEETRWELFKAVDAINWQMHMREEKKWHLIKEAIDQFNAMRRQ